MRLEVHEEVLEAAKKKGIKSDVLTEARGWSTEYFEHTHLDSGDVDVLHKVATDLVVNKKTLGPRVLKSVRGLIRRLNSLRSIGKGEPTTNVETLSEQIRLLVSKLDHQWVFRDDSTMGEAMPYLITKVAYSSPRNRGDDYIPATCHILGVAVRRGHRMSLNEAITREELLTGMNGHQALLAVGLVPESPELLVGYKESLDAYTELRGKIGTQVVLSGMGSNVGDDDDDDYRWWRRNAAIRLDHDDGPGRGIMDDVVGWGKDTSSTVHHKGLTEEAADDESTEGQDVVRLPAHPVLRLFVPKLNTFVTTHINNVTEYIYDRRAFDKVIIPEATKEMIDCLVTAGHEGDDLVSGKGKGVIILSSGPPGTGKTLTAEAYSERAKRPIYSVQCSQIGLTPEKIEENLAEFLDRCTRWGAIGLLDEADVFIRERGDDLQQNAIVGVFLRVLEYYRGVLFMTTNRSSMVDDAVLSRCVLHVRYSVPNEEDSRRIWAIMFEQFGLNLGEVSPKNLQELISQLVKTFEGASGRTIKQLCRLARVTAERSRKRVSMDVFNQVAIFQDVERLKGSAATKFKFSEGDTRGRAFT